MNIVSRVTSLIIAVAILFLYAVTDSVTSKVLAAKKHRTQPHITFSSPDYSLKKVNVDVKGDSEGWRETAEWRSAQGESIVFVNIFAFVSYNKVIMSSHVQPPEQRVYDISGSNSVVLGAKSKVDTDKGFYEYQLYSLNGVQCAYIQSYWGDQSLGGIDFVIGAKKSDTIVGNHILQVNFCDQHKQEMRSKDVTEILSSTDLRDAHWSTSWFVPATEPATPEVGSSETTLDKQAKVESPQKRDLEGVSGTYRSDITSSVSYWFQHKKQRKLIITLKQEGKRITGTDNIGRSELTGTIEGDTIRFNYWSGRTLKGSEVNGEWKVIGDGSRLEGFWTWQGSPQGKWNLTRIE